MFAGLRGGQTLNPRPHLTQMTVEMDGFPKKGRASNPYSARLKGMRTSARRHGV